MKRWIHASRTISSLDKMNGNYIVGNLYDNKILKGGFDTYADAERYLYNLIDAALQSDDASLKDLKILEAADIFEWADDENRYYFADKWLKNKWDNSQRMQLVKKMRRMQKASASPIKDESEKTTLKVKYESYAHKNTDEIVVEGNTLVDALSAMCKELNLYLSPEQIEEEHMDAYDILDDISTSNGDGCDYIIYIRNMTTKQKLL